MNALSEEKEPGVGLSAKVAEKPLEHPQERPPEVERSPETIETVEATEMPGATEIIETETVNEIALEGNQEIEAARIREKDPQEILVEAETLTAVALICHVTGLPVSNPLLETDRPIEIETLEEEETAEIVTQERENDLDLVTIAKQQEDAVDRPYEEERTLATDIAEEMVFAM